MKDIITSIGSFENLISGGYLYVDKTKYLYDLISRPSMYYFLSRPRRFGKSLTLSTLEAIFRGKRELFKGLYAEEPTNVGRIDAVITCPKYIYIVEFKYNQTAEQAIEQIRKKKYWEKYLNMGKEIHLLGINFSTEQKNIAQWKDEVL